MHPRMHEDKLACTPKVCQKMFNATKLAILLNMPYHRPIALKIITLQEKFALIFFLEQLSESLWFINYDWSISHLQCWDARLNVSNIIEPYIFRAIILNNHFPSIISGNGFLKNCNLSTNQHTRHAKVFQLLCFHIWPHTSFKPKQLL